MANFWLAQLGLVTQRWYFPKIASVFYWFIQNKRQEAWLFLIMDGSDITIPFHNLANKIKFILFCLPLHSTHLTHTLDSGIFQLFKHCHTDSIDKAVMKNLANLNFWQRFSYFATKPLSQPLMFLNQQG